MSSGLALPTEEAVFRRSIWAIGVFVGVEVSILLDELLDSHEKGPASFLAGGADAVLAGTAGAFGTDDCAHGKLGRTCDRAVTLMAVDGGDGSEIGSGAMISFEVMVADRDLLPPDSTSPSCTSSRDDVDIR